MFLCFKEITHVIGVELVKLEGSPLLLKAEPILAIFERSMAVDDEYVGLKTDGLIYKTFSVKRKLCYSKLASGPSELSNHLLIHVIGA